jgi:hypothetical protein
LVDTDGVYPNGAINQTAKIHEGSVKVLPHSEEFSADIYLLLDLIGSQRLI